MLPCLNCGGSGHSYFAHIKIIINNNKILSLILDLEKYFPVQLSLWNHHCDRVKVTLFPNMRTSVKFILDDNSPGILLVSNISLTLCVKSCCSKHNSEYIISWFFLDFAIILCNQIKMEESIYFSLDACIAYACIYPWTFRLSCSDSKLSILPL